MKPSLLRDLPSSERPRERLTRLGADALKTEELLAILLRTGRKGEGALALAESILAGAGGLGRLATLSVSQLVKANRLGPVQAVTLAAALELARRVSTEKIQGLKFTSPEIVERYLVENHGRHTQERTGALLLDAKHRLIKDVECYRGTLDRALVEPREICKNALLEDAAAVILYHNHPSGDPSPSAEDEEFTRRLRRAAEAVGIRLLDHVVVGRSGCVSLKERGVL
ncbi:MAG: RadC family protein [Thermoanaerobaculia bacterium]